MSVPDLPPGARLLSADEAVDLLVTGEHPQAGSGTVVLDSALIDALRHGLIVACQLPDGQIAFTPPRHRARPVTAAGATPPATHAAAHRWWVSVAPQPKEMLDVRTKPCTGPCTG